MSHEYRHRGQSPILNTPYNAQFQPRYQAVLSRNIQSFHLTAALAQTQQTMTAMRANRLALAVLLWRLDHGGLPERLEDLVPHYLDALPRDARTGGPFALGAEDGRLVIQSDRAATGRWQGQWLGHMWTSKQDDSPFAWANWDVAMEPQQGGTREGELEILRWEEKPTPQKSAPPTETKEEPSGSGLVNRGKRAAPPPRV